MEKRVVESSPVTTDQEIRIVYGNADGKRKILGLLQWDEEDAVYLFLGTEDNPQWDALQGAETKEKSLVAAHDWIGNEFGY